MRTPFDCLAATALVISRSEAEAISRSGLRSEPDNPTGCDPQGGAILKNGNGGLMRTSGRLPRRGSEYKVR